MKGVSFQRAEKQARLNMQDWRKLMKLKHKAWTVLGLAALLLAVAPAAHAQVNSNTATVNLNAVMGSSLTVAALPATVNFALVVNGVANGNSPVTITTSWVLNPGDAVRLYAYFTSAAAALTNGAGNNIPSANVRGSANGGAFTPFTGLSPFAAASSIRVFVEDPVTAATRTRTDTLNLQLDTTGLTLPAGTYTGVLVIQAQAT
jgi:hypothetical protein